MEKANLFKNKITGEKKEFEDDMDVRLWEPLITKKRPRHLALTIMDISKKKKTVNGVPGKKTKLQYF